MLLLRADGDRWMVGPDRIWLDVRVAANRHTGRDRRPRVHGSVLDRERWYLPTNRSIAGLLGDDSWLQRGGRRLATQGRMDVSWRVDGERPRFVHHHVPVVVAALRLRRRPSQRAGMEILASVELQAQI